MAKKKKENKNQIMTTDAIVTVDRKGEVKQTKPTKNNSYRDEYNYRNNLNPTTERVQTGRNNFKDITSTVSRNVLRNTNKDGYLDTKKKYGDYNKNDLSKSNYKIYQKDNKYYYFDEKDKKYKDMKGYETTTHKIDSRDSGLLNINNKNEMLKQNKDRKRFDPKFVQTTEQKDISKKIASDMAADDSAQEQKWLNSLSKEDKKAYEESAKYQNKLQKEKHKEAQQKEIKKQQQLRFEKDKEAFQKFQNKEQIPSLIEAGNYVRENKAKEEEYLKNNPVAIKGSSNTIRPQDVIPTLNNYKTGEIGVETQPERLETAKERNELARTQYEENLWTERNKETTGLEKVYQPIKSAVAQVGEGLDTPFDFGNRVYISEDGTQQYLPSKSDIQWERTLNSYNTKIGKFAAETTNNMAKILGTQAMNLLIPGSGTAVYWAQMYGNSYQKAFNQTGGDSSKASANALINTGLEFLTGKFLGSATKGLTGGKTSQLETAFSNLSYKISKNPVLSSYLGKAGSEFSEEFIQEYLGNAVDILTLGSDGSHENLKELLSDPDVLEAALYSGLMGAVSSVGIGGVQNLGTRASGGYTEAQSIQLVNDFKDELNNTIEEYKKNPKENKTKIKKLQKVLSELDKENAPFTDDTVQSNIDRAENINKSINSTYSDEQKAQIDEIEQMVNSGEIDADEGTGYIRQVQNGTYAEHRNLERIAQQRMDEVQQAFRDGQISGDEYNQELKAINATLQSERNRIEGIEEQTELNTPQIQAQASETTQGNAIAQETQNVSENKQKQLDIIEKNNPANPESSQTWIKSVDDIKTLNETLQDDDYEGYDEFTPDLTRQDIQNAIEKGTITVYSSHPIEQGEFVTPSKMEAESYAGNGQIYSQEVPIQDVAWIDPTQGQYAKVQNNNIEINQDNQSESKSNSEDYWKSKGVKGEVAKILSTEDLKEEKSKSILQKIKEGKATIGEEIQQFKRKFVDKGSFIRKLSKLKKNRKLDAKYDKMGTAEAEAQYSIGKAQSNLKGIAYNNFKDKNGKNVSMSWNDIWKGIDEDAANEYLANWLNVDRYGKVNEEGRKLQENLAKQVKEEKITQEEANKILEEKRENGELYKYVLSPEITDKDSAQRIAELDEKHPELKLFAENVWQYYKNQLQNRIEAGKISKEEAERFENETPHYVRLQREVPKNAPNTLEIDNNGNATINKNIKEFKGSTRNIISFKTAGADYTQKVMNEIRMNEFAKELAKTLGVSSELNGEISTIDEIFGVDQNLIKDNGDGTYQLTFFNNGVATTIPINKAIYEAMQPNKHYKWEDKTLFKGIRKVDSWRRALLTDKNPIFLATNMMKDLFDAPLNSKYPVAFAKNYPRAIKEIATGGKYFKQYQALGGLQNTYFENEGFKKQGSKLNPLNWIGKANEIIEQLPRLAEFISTMEKTGDVNEAMFNAAEITTNFKRGGDYTKALNRNGATFLNASVQGFSKQVRNFTEINNPTQAVQLLAKIVVLGIGPALFNDFVYEDDDEYKELQDYQKDRYYLIKGENGTWIRIPKGRAVSIFQSAARRTKYFMRGDKDAFKGLGELTQSQIAPNNPFESNIISPFVNVATNKSWSGNPIVSEYMERTVKPKDQWDAKTDEFSKWLGQKTNLSPKKINYIVDQYSGAIGDFVLPNITKYKTHELNNFLDFLLNPARDKFTTNIANSNKSQNEFYDAITQNEKDHTEEGELRGKYLSLESKKISDLRNEMMDYQASDASDKDKIKKTREYLNEINKIAKEATEKSKDIKIGEYTTSIGDYTYYKDSSGKWRKESEKTAKHRSWDNISAEDYYAQKQAENNAADNRIENTVKALNFNSDDYEMYSYKIGQLKADKDANGKTINGSKKKKVIEYVNSLPISDVQKAALLKKQKYKVSGYDQKIANEINKSGLTQAEKNEIYSYLNLGR